MKGIIIYGNPMWGDNERATYCEYINNASFELTQYAPKEVISCLKGEALESSKAVCSEDDTYDFMTGALIALMKMCGVDKVVRACNEAFSEDMFKTYATMYERELNTLKKDFDKVRDLKDFYKKNYEDVKEHYGKLGERNIYLIEDINKKLEYIKEKDEEIKNLKKEKEQIIVARSILNNKLLEENKKLKKNIDELFESEQYSKSELGRLYFEKHRLEEEVEKLKIDCEKLQHGYNDMIFCGGRGTGKQYKALVELFKKIDQKKVDAALDINGTIYRKSIQIKDFGEQINKLTVDSLIEESRAFTRKCVDEWLFKIPTKREVMWKNIKNFKGDSCIEVNRADVIDFLKELEEEMPEVHWVSGRKPTDIPYHMFNYEYDKVYFFIDDRYITYDFDKQTSRTNVQYVNYLPPMRWDLFKKGRLAVKVDFDNYKEFYEACKKELGKRPLTNFACVFTVSICKDDGFFEIFTVEDQKKTGRKIVDWEDVR